MSARSATAVDWGQFWCPGRSLPFTADEMARAGSDPPSRTLVTVVTLNVALVGFVHRSRIGTVVIDCRTDDFGRATAFRSAA